MKIFFHPVEIITPYTQHSVQPIPAQSTARILRGIRELEGEPITLNLRIQRCGTSKPHASSFSTGIVDAVQVGNDVNPRLAGVSRMSAPSSNEVTDPHIVRTRIQTVQSGSTRRDRRYQLPVYGWKAGKTFCTKQRRYSRGR